MAHGENKERQAARKIHKAAARIATKEYEAKLAADRAAGIDRTIYVDRPHHCPRLPYPHFETAECKWYRKK
jgi:hypothetical protein